MRDIKRTAVTELFRILKMPLRVIFSILNNLSLRRNIYLNIQKFTREKKNFFLAKVNSRCFFLFPHGVHILSNNSSTEYRTDLRLGQVSYLLIIYNMSISIFPNLSLVQSKKISGFLRMYAKKSHMIWLFQ